MKRTRVHRGRSVGSRTTDARREPVVRAVRDAFGCSREKFRRLSGFSVRAQASWESGTQKPGEQAVLRLVELRRLRAALGRVMREESIPEWLDAPNDAFDGLKPLEVVERGETDRLWRMIFELESGIAA